ncbi:MAG: hypothetical protein ACKO37_09320 [Vampirovibrionales bacterium]
MRELYPIGTQLVTRRLSQAALYDERINLAEMESFLGSIWVRGFYREATKWRVAIIEYNQKWLSPVPIVGDMMFPCVIDRQDGVFGAIVNDPNSGYWYRKDRKVVLRTYPNGQRAPLIEWDEVILPEGVVV